MQVDNESTFCPVCTSDQCLDFLQIKNLPVHCNLLWSTRSGATTALRGDILLSFCENCGHVFNKLFDPGLMEYKQEYENSLHFSPRFQQYAQELATSLVDRYNLRNKKIIEVGSGQGDFLKMLCQLGDNQGVGFDPSYVQEQEFQSMNDRVNIIRDFYTEKYSHYITDFILSRHVLEHIERPNEFLSMIRRVIDQRVHIIVFFEVPNVFYTLHQNGIWDIIYEHCSYFSRYSLETVFQLAGFEVLRISETFNGQFLTIEASPRGEKANRIERNPMDLLQMREDINRFQENYLSKVSLWQKTLSDLTLRGKKAVVWGAGSKGVTFLNVMDVENVIDHVVDINPRKRGKFVAGSGQEIIHPENLKEISPDVVIIMNPNYKDEISHSIRQMDISVDIMVA